jgi:hypothetical protein
MAWISTPLSPTSVPLVRGMTLEISSIGRLHEKEDDILMDFGVYCREVGYSLCFIVLTGAKL